MWIDIILLVAGLVLILMGANYLTDGASAMAKKFGVSDLVIGLTVVAFGTSAPELVISVISAINDSAELAIGNVVGSNIFNILMIVGITAIVLPIKVERSIMSNEIPLVILSSIALFVIGCSQWLNGGTTGSILTRVDGLLLLLFFLIFMRYTFSQAKKGNSNDPVAENGAATSMPLWKSSLYVVAGLAALIYGGNIFVDGASAIARALGVSEAVIGLTIVAMGTSAPELATSIVAALKGKTGIAIGNVIGSNIFNIFLVLGISGSIANLPFGNISLLDLSVLLVASLLFWLFADIFGERVIKRGEGVAMVVLYIGYIAYLIVA